MTRKVPSLYLFFIALVWAATSHAASIGDGVSHDLALYRSQHISDVAYHLAFHIPQERQHKVSGTAEVLFVYDGKEDLQFDFSGEIFPGECYVNDRLRRVQWQNEHIVIPRRYLATGGNVVRFEFFAADKALNRSDGYLYTLFVPAHARSVFPCFDQPDIKARFSLKLELPEGWTSVNSADCGQKIPTYLFSFVAGKFRETTAQRDGRTMRALYRETDARKVAQLDKVFDEAALSIKWLERYTNIRYPFAQYNFVVLPGYQFGGMEHPGAIQYTDKEIFLGPTPTPDEELRRLELIAHETAHMWFGDMVTMRWFDDVWTKEVFANFFASKIARLVYPNVNHDQNFLKAYQTRALSTDRTDGTHPIQQQLDNLKDAGLLYGNIIYHKAPVMMRKLEQQMGEKAFQKGIRDYLLTFAYGNATWDDLIHILANAAPQAAIDDFSQTWVKQKGLPLITTEYERDSIIVRQLDPYGRNLAWKQKFKVGLFYSDQEPVQVLDVDLQQPRAAYKVERKPYVILPNYDGSGYGRFIADRKALEVAGLAWQWMPDDLPRYASLLTLYENYQMGKIEAADLLGMLNTWLFNEPNELIASTLCSYIATAAFDLDAKSRSMAEYFMLNAATKHPIPSVRLQMMRSLSGTATSPSIVKELYAIWQQHSDTLLTEADYTNMAYHLAIALPQQWQQILLQQRSRLRNDDERRAFDFIARACNPDAAVQQELFQSLLDPAHRSVEPWAAKMLSLLSCNEREAISNAYITPGLNALQEVQRTGAIFFPGNWLHALLAGHKSNEARQLVQQFIDTHPAYPEALMNKIKENAYYLLNR